jgi:hypothetical protein
VPATLLSLQLAGVRLAHAMSTCCHLRRRCPLYLQPLSTNVPYPARGCVQNQVSCAHAGLDEQLSSTAHSP